MADNDTRCFVKDGDIYCSNEVYNKVFADPAISHKYWFIPNRLSLDTRIFATSSAELDKLEKEFTLSRKE